MTASGCVDRVEDAVSTGRHRTEERTIPGGYDSLRRARAGTAGARRDRPRRTQRPAGNRGAGPQRSPVASTPRTRRRTAMIPTAPFGRTGHESSRVIFGAAGLGVDAPGAGRRGAWRSCDGTGSTTSTPPPATATPSCASRRGWPSTATGFFLATKTGERAGDAARAELERSLERLQVDLSTSSSSTTWSSPTSGTSPTGPAARWRRSPGPRTRGSSATSASPGTACASPACTCAASSASRSPRSCCRTATWP